jgi:hypothetical protein
LVAYDVMTWDFLAITIHHSHMAERLQATEK